ncbi:MAG: glycoside hydrolase/phage tail family protein [Aliishimia sp.]
MATILLSAAGAAVGGSVGGTLAGLSSVAIGRAVGATLGKVIDQQLMGSGSQAVETGRVDRFRITNAGEGNPITQIYGRVRIGGQVIWASDFLESKTTSGGGKGSSPQTSTTSYSYSVSLAVALCEGEITRVGRVWADGEEIALTDLNMRVYLGTKDQQPDSSIEAVEGAGNVPAYRGTAYVVFDALQLAQFGNRIPQFSFEVSRPEQPGGDVSLDLTRAIEAVAVMPGTGEYALATTPVHYTDGPGSRWSANVNTPAGVTDFDASLSALDEELPNVGAASLIVSWFGNDLRCQHCTVRPKIEKRENEGENMPWRVAGMDRASAEAMELVDGEPIYGGTPADQSVIEAIQALQAANKGVMFYPFILMDQMDGNTLADPYGADAQPTLPWRGRITLDVAPGIAGSTDGTSNAADEIDAFFGAARASDFTVSDGAVNYAGPAEDWGFARFILHYAALCAAAGGVDSFCIGSEMRGLTQIRSGANTFPFVGKLMQLASDARVLLGSSVKIGYAADWSEYFGYMPQDGSGDRLFHLDPLWADPDIDFVGIDNYMPLSDWREGGDHADVGAGSIYDLDYLRGNIAGGEGYDWYYASSEDAETQTRSLISDGVHNEPWVWRYKDIRGWWENAHHERIAGVRQASSTDWVPQSKPIWFTEYGCAAIDKGANQPNKFLDQKSSESALPAFSNGGRDDLMQMQYLRATTSYWSDSSVNPTSGLYGGPMVDMSRAFVWAWDARPYPFFPNNLGQWSDGENYARGHWLSGRTAGRPLSSVVEEICTRAGIVAFDTSGLFGYVRGYTVDAVSSGRAALQPLMLRYGFDAVERDGVLRFTMRGANTTTNLDPAWLVRADDIEGLIEQDRDPELEMSGRMRLQFVQADGDYDALSEEAVLPDDATHGVATSELPLVMTRGEGRQTVERWLVEARVGRDRARFALPPSQFRIGAGDVVTLPDEAGEGLVQFRIDRIEQGPLQIIEAVRIEPSLYVPADVIEDQPALKPFVPPVPVTPLFLDLPLLGGDETPHAPHVAATASPWPGSVAVYKSSLDANYALNSVLEARAVAGTTKNDLARAPHGIWDHGPGLVVKIAAGILESTEPDAVLAGANLAVIGDGSSSNWEVFQFTSAELIAPATYRLTGRLRGQQGTDALMPDIWPEGSWFVLLDGGPQQIDLNANQRQVSQHFRVGPAQRGYDDTSYTHLETAFDGNGLRPYAPSHLRTEINASGDVNATWVRRTRIDGDIWLGEVPLGEDTETYRIQVLSNDVVLREVETSSPNWTYSSSDQSLDGAIGQISLSVAQISARYGPGLSAQTRLDL